MAQNVDSCVKDTARLESAVNEAYERFKDSAHRLEKAGEVANDTLAELSLFLDGMSCGVPFSVDLRRSFTLQRDCGDEYDEWEEVYAYWHREGTKFALGIGICKDDETGQSAPESVADWPRWKSAPRWARILAASKIRDILGAGAEANNRAVQGLHDALKAEVQVAGGDA